MRRRPPHTIPGLLEFTGGAVYGPCWRGRLASGLGISRSTLRLWLLGLAKSDRDIASELILLVDRERAATGTRAVELTALRHDIVAGAKRANLDAA
jgi:hypothetical protein